MIIGEKMVKCICKSTRTWYNKKTLNRVLMQAAQAY